MGTDPSVPETSAVPAELTGQLPRRIRLTESGIKSVKIISALLLVGVVGSLWVYHTVRKGQEVAALRRSESETTGEMKRVWFAGGARVP